jgi:hypothetical protein
MLLAELIKHLRLIACRGRCTVLGPLSLSVPWRRYTWNAHKWKIFHKVARELLYMQYIQFCQVPIQEAKYVESWPNTTSAWAGWRGFEIPVDRSDRVHSLLQCTEVSYLLLGLLSKISKSGQGQHSVCSVVCIGSRGSPMCWCHLRLLKLQLKYVSL